jgi:phage-related protein
MQVRYKLGQAAFAIQASTAIREAIKALVESLGINPVSAFVADIARKIAGYLRKILKILKQVNRFVKDVVQQVLLMKAIIEFIQALPDYLRRIFDRCLREIFRELATFVFDLISNAIPDLGADDAFAAIGDAVSTASQVIDAANQTIVLGQQLERALNPDIPSGFSPAETERIIAAEFPDYVPIREKVLGPIL